MAMLSAGEARSVSTVGDFPVQKQAGFDKKGLESVAFRR
jgi:hypothetical protein